MFAVGACGAPGEAGRTVTTGAPAGETAEVPGVDTSSLTRDEVRTWSAFVSELQAPCSTVTVSLKHCVKDGRDCRTCLPAARFLVSQVRRGKLPAQIEAAFHARFDPDRVQSIPIGNAQMRGARQPTVTIVEWADYQCPACGAAAPRLDAAMKAHPNDVRVVFKHYPLASHPLADGAARAAVAAAKQGKFWVMHDLMYKNQDKLDEHGLKELAVEAGLDLATFIQDSRDEATRQVIMADMREADRLGLRGTPMVYINGRLFDLDHFVLAEDLEAWIELEIELHSATSAAEASAAGGQR
jgi:protein-disulfide isomerase